MVEEIKKKILRVVSKRDFSKGLEYNENYIEYISCTNVVREKRFQFLVESEHTYRKYMVQIDVSQNNIVDTYCTCPQFLTTNSCKHVAACLIVYSDMIFLMNNENPEKKSLQILSKLQKEFEVSFTIKSELFLDPYLVIDSSYYGIHLMLKVKIGNKKKYSLLGKFNDFLNAWRKNQSFTFGKDLVVSPLTHFFSPKSAQFLDLLELIRGYSQVQGNSVRLNDKFFRSFITLYSEGIYMENPLRFISICQGFPVGVNLAKKEDKYYLSFQDIYQMIPLTTDYEYIFYEDCIYHLTNEQRFLLNQCIHEDIEELILPENQFSEMQKSVLSLVKDKIVLDESVKDLVLDVKPKVRFYFDLNENYISCVPKFVYQNIEVSYFENNSLVIKDLDYEEKSVQVLNSFHFVKVKDVFLLDDFDDIYEFLDEGLPSLAQEYEVFTSENLKKIKVLKQNTVSSTFRIGKDNILHYDFDLGAIGEDELESVLNSLKKNKKYYRLKDGSILSLKEKSLQELEALTEELELDPKDLGHGKIPKYRALYLEALKEEKYGCIKTDSLFQNFISQFKEYQDVKLSFTKDENKILRDYQKLGVKWLYTIFKCGFGGILADEMGLGKSLQTICFIRKLLKENPDARFLIVCPTSLVYNWESEFTKFAPSLSYKVFASSKEKRKSELNDFHGNIYITSYGLLREDLEFYQQQSFLVFVIDEAQNIKNPKTGLTKAVKSIEANTKIALTGTPIENSVVELWSIFDFIMPGFLASLVRFQQKYKVKDFDEETNLLLENLKKQVEPFILRRKKKDVVKDLPMKTENNIYIDLNEEQKKIYAAEVKNANEEMTTLIQNGGFAKNKMIILSLLTKLRQICISPSLILKNYQNGSSKMENLLKIIKELVINGHKILLFTSFKMALEMVKKMLDEEGISSYTIAGDVSAQKRKMLVDAFNKDDTNVFLIMLKSGGTGLNLTSADVVIHLDLWWNPQAENQATDRTHRIGQTKNVEVIKLICKGTIEEKILTLQQKKKLLSDKILEGGMDDASYLKKLTEKDIRDLLSYENAD